MTRIWTLTVREHQPVSDEKAVKPPPIIRQHNVQADDLVQAIDRFHEKLLEEQPEHADRFEVTGGVLAHEAE